MADNYYDSRQFSEYQGKVDWGDDGSSGKRSSLHIMSILKKYSTAATNKFCVEFKLADPVLKYIKQRHSTFFDVNMDEIGLNRIKLNCMSVTGPEKTYGFTDALDSGHEEKVPYSYDINQIQLEFNCMADMKERILFEYWMEFIFDIKGRSYMFISDYVTDINIFQLNAKNEATYCIIAGSAFPVGVSSVRYDSSPSNTSARVTVTLAYQYMDTLNYS
jgi:hypothetical protein